MFLDLSFSQEKDLNSNEIDLAHVPFCCGATYLIKFVEISFALR